MTGGSNYRKVYVGKAPIHIRARDSFRARFPLVRWWHLVGAALLLAALLALIVKLWPGHALHKDTLAVVSGNFISAADVDAEARGQGVPPDRLTPELRKKLLETVIDRRVLIAAAQKQGVDKDPIFISQRARANEIMLASVVADRVSDGKADVSDAAAQKFMADHPLQFASRQAILVDGLVADLRPVPPARLAQANTIEDIAAILGKLGIEFERSRQRLDSATLPPPVAVKLVQAQPGLTFILPMGAKSLAGTVIERQPAVAPPAQQLQAARAGAAQDITRRRVAAAIASLRAREEIRYVK